MVNLSLPLPFWRRAGTSHPPGTLSTQWVFRVLRAEPESHPAPLGSVEVSAVHDHTAF